MTLNAAKGCFLPRNGGPAASGPCQPSIFDKPSSAPGRHHVLNDGEECSGRQRKDKDGFIVVAGEK